MQLCHLLWGHQAVLSQWPWWPSSCLHPSSLQRPGSSHRQAFLHWAHLPGAQPDAEPHLRRPRHHVPGATGLRWTQSPQCQAEQGRGVGGGQADKPGARRSPGCVPSAPQHSWRRRPSSTRPGSPARRVCRETSHGEGSLPAPRNCVCTFLGPSPPPP